METYRVKTIFSSCDGKDTLLLEEALDNGMFIADLHRHSWASQDVAISEETSPDRLYASSLARGACHVAFTDHNTISGLEQLENHGRQDRLIWGIELYMTLRKADRLDLDFRPFQIHLNVYPLEGRLYANDEHDLIQAADSGDLDLFTSFVEELGFVWLYNHPLWVDRADLQTFDYALPAGIIRKYANLVEINAVSHRYQNDWVHAVARTFDVPIICTTDSHTDRVMYAAGAAKADCFPEFLAKVKAGESYHMRADATEASLATDVDRLIYLVQNPGVYRSMRSGRMFDMEIGPDPLRRALSLMYHHPNMFPFKQAGQLARVMSKTKIGKEALLMIYH